MSDAVPRPTTDTRLRTLVVEDDPTDRKLLEELLRQRGHEVESHADPGAALDAFRDGRHDLVLLDMGLPGMDGASLCRKIRKVPRSRDTFIVSITGSDQVESLESALQSGADDFIAKPLDRDHFRIRLAVAERQVQSAREQKRLTEELTRNQALDPLTGLESQPSLMEHVGDAIQRAAREPDFIFAVLELNLDDFALASSRVGQETGDLLLRAAGNRIRPTVRAVDMVARGAGDGFLILLNGIKDVSDAVRVANRIQEAFTTPFLIGQHSELISVGIGIALSLSGYEDAEQIVRDAHRALRWAKAEGPATSRIFDPEMHSLAQRRIQTEDRIRSALAEDRLELWYQPILSVETMRIRGFEALVRMRDTGGELISPGEFIPVAEESGLIVPEEPSGWEVRGLLPGGGPFISEDRIVPLDVSRVQGEEVRIRIRPPVGFWGLNSFQMDFGTNEPVQVEKLAPTIARTSAGVGVLPSLAAVDDAYYAMPEPGDWAELRFPAVDPPQGMEETFILSSQGYYRLHLTAGQTPDVAALREIETVPDAPVWEAIESYAAARATALAGEGGGTER